MNVETLLSQVMPEIETIIRTRLVEMAEKHTLYTLEEQTHQLLRQIGQRVLQIMVNQEGSGLEGPERPCSTCGGQQQYHDQQHPLRLITSLGEIQVRQRASYRCPHCHTSSYPLDQKLGLRQCGRTSRYVQEFMGWLITAESMGAARETLAKFWGIGIPSSQIRTQGEALGTEIDELLTERITRIQEETQHLAPLTPLRQPTAENRIYAAPDGWMYLTTERDAQGHLLWKEAKAAAIYAAEAGQPEADPEKVEMRTLRQRIAAQLPPPVPVSDRPKEVGYVISMQGTWQDAGPWIWAELHERGAGTRIGDVTVVADGGEGLSQMVESHLRPRHVQTTSVLDICHAQQHLYEVAQELAEGQRGCMVGALFALEQGDLSCLLAILEDVATEYPYVAKKAATAQAYFETRFRQIDYPTFVQQGRQIGSGMAESAYKRFGTDRMKGTGMRWTSPGAQSVATLRALRLSHRWHEVSSLCSAA
jgi:hypothetical protein